MTDIISAIATKNIAALQACFERGDDVDAFYKVINASGISDEVLPIWYACQTRFEKGALLLLDKSSMPSLFFQNHDGINPLLLSCSFSLSVVKKLTEIDRMVGYCDNQGVTPLMCAALFNQCEIIKHLLDFGHDLNAKNHLNQNALFYSIQSHFLDSTRLLLDKNIPIDDQDCHGSTALMNVICDKNIWTNEHEHGDRLIHCLLDYHANPYLENQKGKNAIHLAILQDSKLPLAPLLIRSHVIIDKRYQQYAEDHQCLSSLDVLKSYLENLSLTDITKDRPDCPDTPDNYLKF